MADGRLVAGMEYKSQVGAYGNDYNNRTEEAPGSMSPVANREPHFGVFLEFRSASYAKRYEILLTKLVRERLYDAACFLLSDASNGPKGDYREPASELGFDNFAASLLGHAMAVAKAKL